MGELIRRTAAADDIIADVRATLMTAAAKGGAWKELAEERLAGVVALVDNVDLQLQKAEAKLEPLLAALDAKNEDADAVLGRVSDEIWNEVGRPAADPALAVLFPGGVAYYADASVDKQPARMDLLAELLESRIHPRLSPEQVKAHAKDIRASANELRTAVDAVAGPNERVDLLQRVRRALATVAHADLTSLKRLYKNAHFSQADIHGVIPDRPAAAKKAGTGPADPGTSAPPGSATPL
jgi:hypothetical protein